MEMNKVEVAELEQVTKESVQDQVQELAELQLALVGGGLGSVIFV